MKGRNWTIGEIEMLRDNYGDLSTKEMALMLNRTRSSINNQIAKLGLKAHIKPSTDLPTPEDYPQHSDYMVSEDLPKFKDDVVEFSIANSQVTIDFTTREVIIKQI